MCLVDLSVLMIFGCGRPSTRSSATVVAARDDEMDEAAIPLTRDATGWKRDWTRVKGPSMVQVQGKPLFVLIQFDPEYDNIVPVVVKRDSGSEYRLLAVDQTGERLPLTQVAGLGTDAATIKLLTPKSGGEIKKTLRLTVEGLSEEAKAYLARQAYEQARSNGIYLLPPPEGGKPYQFSLKTTDGKVIDSSQLRGTVTLVECWQVECPPCISFIKDKLGSLAKKYGRELSLISINMKDEPSAADAKLRELLGELPPNLKHVCIPPDERDTWFKSLGLKGVPYFLIIDKEGRLYPEFENLSGEEIPEILEKLLGR